MPKFKVRERHIINYSKSKSGKGGPHDEDDDSAPHETVISMVDHVLDSKGGNPNEGKKIATKLKLSSLIKSKKPNNARRRRASRSESSTDDEDFFTENCRLSFLRSSEHDDSVRTSDRLKKKYGPSELDKKTSSAEDEPFKNKDGDAGKSLNHGTVSSLKSENKATGSPPRRVKFQNIPAEEVDEMVRSLSQCSRPGSANDRPQSQTDSRPGSRPGSRSDRPGSRLLNKSRKHFGFTIDSIEEPDRDSPVLTPRLRHQEMSNRSPRSKSPLIPKTVIKVAHKTPSLAPPPPVVPAVSLDKFKQINIRKSKQKKVHKILEKQKRKAEKNTKKKLLGFGQRKDEAEKPIPRTESKHHLKKAQVTEEERDLIAQLLQVGEQAVKETVVVLDPEPAVRSTVGSILDFEEANGMADTEVLEEIDSLFSAL